MPRLRMAATLAVVGSLLGVGTAAGREADALACVAGTEVVAAQASSSGYRREVHDVRRLQGAEASATESVIAGVGGVQIAVYFHVIQSGSAGAVTPVQIADQIDVLNASFAASGWQFVLAGVTVTNNATWFNEFRNGSQVEKAAKAALRTGSADDLNIYTANLQGGMLGFSSFPWEYSKNPVDDGVALLYSTLPGGSAFPYNAGDSAVHEVGTWMGLLNTFAGGCNKKGDLVEDTPAERNPAFLCEERDSCKAPGTDPIHNFMDFGEDACMDHFTPGQANRMDAMWVIYRDGN